MAEPHQPAQPHAAPPRGRAATWPDGASRGRSGDVPVPSRLGDGAAAMLSRLSDWGRAELAPGRLFPWLPIAFATGVILYMAAEREPALWAAAAALAAALAAVFATRRRPAVLVAIGIAAVAAGFLATTLRGRLVDAPVLREPVFGARLVGVVEAREERERSDRVVLRVQAVEPPRRATMPADGRWPERVRVAVRKGTAPPVGAAVAVTARLVPPLPPLRPGGYDLARDLYFRGIGASGFVLGAVRPQPAPAIRDGWIVAAAAIDQVRGAIDRRIRQALPGDGGAIASALITGKRDAISPVVADAMMVSSLAHVLSISGYHMAVVAGVVFAVVRGALALVPGLALRRPVKSWAAAVALVAAALYLVLSGAEVATRRAFLMTAIVLVGVMLNRRALTLRTLAVAALAVMVASPEAVVHPSFQMSFAATLALVAVYEGGQSWLVPSPRSALAARLALWGVREIVALVVASLVAGIATTIFAAYHFHRLAPYGVLANLAAMPVVSGLVMPAGLLGLVLLPFGFDGPLWRLMGTGIDWMTAVALWVAGLPGAVGRIAAFGIGPLVVASLGLVVLALLRTPLRWAGAGLLVGAALWAMATPRPDVLIAPGGDTVAVRGADGRLVVMRTGSLALATRDWLAADGDARLPAAAEASGGRGGGFVCDPDGCVAHLADGSAVAVPRTAAAFGDDCRRAALIVSTRDPPPGCRAMVIDRAMLRETGALALRRVGEDFVVVPTRLAGTDRPWSPAPAIAARGPDPAAGATGVTPMPQPPRRLPDATPETDDLEAEDGPTADPVSAAPKGMSAGGAPDRSGPDPDRSSADPDRDDAP
ncbi:ComE operon protein 3 [Rhodoplanes serenus]|uniref:ComE operon protein 3 n=1 Tax=Rhodoplanes serenus TaxID=200615 RepID=A0A3S4CL92_9BRAD|nr:ComEC/Rec2 family competence protein [Rhodoplanes serenus]VCU11745.1 ComE operon protein 3 [Rhodoplanes serenus]